VTVTGATNNKLNGTIWQQDQPIMLLELWFY